MQVGSFTAYGENLEHLVSAMADFEIQTGVGAVIPTDVSNELQQVLANSWHLLGNTSKWLIYI